MSQITLTAGAYPAFLSKNYINRDCNTAGDMVLSSGDALKYRLYDNDFAAVWSSAGSSDGVTETITVGLWEGALQASRSIDFIAIMATNIKNFLLQYSNDDGANYTNVTGASYVNGVANFSGTNLILALASPITANKLKLTMTHVQSGTEKTIGGFIAALGTLQLSKGMTKYEPSRRENRKDVEMADGSVAYGFLYRSDASFEFYDARVGYRFATAAERTALRAIKNTVQAFLWYPEPGDAVQDIYLCAMKPGSFKDPYATTYKGAGYDIEFDLTEVGGG